MEKQQVVRQCDFCEAKFTFGVGELTPSIQAELGHWVGTVRLIPQPNGQFLPEQRHYCRTGCAINGLKIASEIKLTDAVQPGESATSGIITPPGTNIAGEVIAG